MRVGALVDVEVVVRGERRHPEVDLERRAHLVERLAVEPLEDLRRGRLDVRGELGDLRRVVVVALELVADELDHRLQLLAEGGEHELVAPHGVPAVLALVGLDALGDEPPAALARARGRPGAPRRGPANSRASSGSAFASSFISQIDRILSQFRSRAEFWSRPRSVSSTRPWVCSITARSLSVALSWAKLSIQWIFQWRSWMSIASSSSTASCASVRSALRSSIPSRNAKLRSISGTRRSRQVSANSSP